MNAHPRRNTERNHRRVGAWLRSKLASHAPFLVVSLVCVTVLTMLRIADPLVVRNSRETAFDMIQRMTPRLYLEAPVRIVDIDELSLEQLGQWPWPRDMLADLVDRLHAAGAGAVAFDFIFAEPDRLSPSRLIDSPLLKSIRGVGAVGEKLTLPDNDKLFADAMRRGNVVLGFAGSTTPGPSPPVKAGFAYTGEDPASFASQIRGGALVLPELAEAAAGVGSVTLRDQFSFGVVRRIPLVWGDGESLYPSLVTEALRVAQGVGGYVVHASPTTGVIQSVRVGAFDVPTGPTGELNMYYSSPQPSRYISAADIFDDARLAALAPKIEGRIILIGTSAAGLFDIRKTSHGFSVPGVEIHAQAIEQIINGQFLLRHDWTRGMELLATVLAVLSITAMTMYSGARVGLLFGGAVAILICLSAWDALFQYSLLIDPSFPLGGGMIAWFVSTAFKHLTVDREKREIRGAFSHYVHPLVMKEIERNHSDLRLGGENCELTVMFTDVRDFTRLSERVEPEELVTFLNTLFGRLGDEIVREGGVIDKFIGDSVMAFWNAPLRQEDHTRRACAAALQMRAAMREMNVAGDFGLPEEVAKGSAVEIGIGINTGPACVGNVGSADRFNYSAIGDAVNVAARAESACKGVGYDVVVTGATAETVPEFAFIEAGRVPLKGKAEPVALMLLIGGGEVKASPQFIEFSQRYRLLVEALRGGRGPATDTAMADCRSLAAALDPRLMQFLDLIPGRMEDFRPPPKPAIGLVSGG